MAADIPLTHCCFCITVFFVCFFLALYVLLFVLYMFWGQSYPGYIPFVQLFFPSLDKICIWLTFNKEIGAGVQVKETTSMKNIFNGAGIPIEYIVQLVYVSNSPSASKVTSS